MMNFQGLDLLTTSVIIVDANNVIVYVNPAFENLIEKPSKKTCGMQLDAIFPDAKELFDDMKRVRETHFVIKRQNYVLEKHPESMVVDMVLAQVDLGNATILLEIKEVQQQYQSDKEEKLLEQAKANQELIRNLAHEIKNPLGGIRGAAQLLELDLPNPTLQEFTQLIIKEADRLQILVDRLLAPSRMRQYLEKVNIHEILEQVRVVVLAQYGQQLAIKRDYDLSIPDVNVDKQQLTQVLLNITQNAAEALQNKNAQESRQILLKTRVARQITLNKHRHRLALEMDILDNGEGIPENMRPHVFSPLVSTKENGSGLGLTLAQAIIASHGGVIVHDVVYDAQEKWTCFKILLPME